MNTTNVPLDFLEANAIIAALEQRHRTLMGHVENGVRDDALDAAILQTMRAEDAIRQAFRIPSEASLDALHEALHADLDDLAHIEDVPLALLYDSRADEYRTRGA